MAYLYDDSGQRIKKWNGSSTVFYVGPHYEVEVGDGSVIAASLKQSQQLLVDEGMSPDDARAALYLPFLSASATEGNLDLETVQAADINATTIIKYYYFNGMRIGVRKGGTFYYLHGDRLGSTYLSTNDSGEQHANYSYQAYGSKRGGTPASLPTDNRFTGQKLDTTGLLTKWSLCDIVLQ